MLDLPKNFALAKVSSTLPEPEEELPPHAARTGAAAAAPSAAPPSCRSRRRLRGVGVLRETIAAPLHVSAGFSCRYMRPYACSREGVNEYGAESRRKRQLIAETGIDHGGAGTARTAP